MCRKGRFEDGPHGGDDGLILEDSLRHLPKKEGGQREGCLTNRRLLALMLQEPDEKVNYSSTLSNIYDSR